MPDLEPLSPELAERYYIAFCVEFQLDPEEQQSARAFEDWFNALHGE